MNNTVFQLMFYCVRAFYPAFSWLNASELLAQSHLETGAFTSDIFKENRNLFGMRQPGKRKTLSRGPHRNHASYGTYLDSMRDYFLWLTALRITSHAAWIDFLSTQAGTEGKLGYAEGPKYFLRLKQVEAKLHRDGALVDVVGMGLVVLVAFFLSVNF